MHKSNPIAADALDGIPSAVLSRFFSTRLLRELADSTRTFASRLETLPCRPELPSRASICDFYERALDALIRNDRSEYVYKNAIAQKLLLGRHSVNSASLLFEFRVGQSKLDALLINGHSHAFEIKTAQDELRRLDSQIADYQRTFTHVSIFTSWKHVEKVRAMVRKEVGISVLSKRYQISTVRRPQKRVHQLEVSAMIGALRQNELISALKEVGVSLPPMPNTWIREEATRQAAAIQPVRFQGAMLHQLRKRHQQRQTQVARALPRPLTAVGLSLSLTDRKIDSLVRRLQTRLGEL